MEIVKITKVRMEQILPQNVKDSDLSVNAKKMLATIINYHLVDDKVRSAGFLAINNENLRQSTGIGKEYLKNTWKELEECKLITRKAGKKWKTGEKSEASEYRLILENIKKFTKKPTADELLETLFSAPLESPSTKESPTILYYTNSITNTTTTSTTTTSTDTNTTSSTELDSTRTKQNYTTTTLHNSTDTYKEYDRLDSIRSESEGTENGCSLFGNVDSVISEDYEPDSDDRSIQEVMEAQRWLEDVKRKWAERHSSVSTKNNSPVHSDYNEDELPF